MTTITHPALVAALVKPPLDIIVTLSEFGVDLWHGATGVAGECGELLECLTATPDMNKVDRTNLVEELGDLYFYIEQVRRRAALGRGDISAARELIIAPDNIVNLAVQASIYGSQVLDTVKKCAIYNKTLNLFALEDQLNRLDVYLTAIEYAFGIKHEEVLQANIDKLSVRYASLSYSDKAAQERADKVTAADLAPPQARTHDMQSVVDAEKSA